MSTLKLCDTLFVFCQRGICFGMYFYMLGGEIYFEKNENTFCSPTWKYGLWCGMFSNAF